MRRLAHAMTAAALTLAVIGVASPTNAAQVGTITVAGAGGTPCDGADRNTYSRTNTGGSVVFGSYTFSGTGTDTISVTNNCTSRDIFVVQGGTSTTVAQNGGSANVSLSGGNFGIYTASTGGNLIEGYAVQVSGGGGGGGGGGSSSSSSSLSSTPTVETLNVEVSGSDTTCTGGNPSANFGSWLTLPSADECTQTGPKANPGAKLLGWATNPNFPQAIAQRQVDNGWGAYETFNEDGQLTGVFIPAGGATFVSGSNNLYPIWSS